MFKKLNHDDYVKLKYLNFVKSLDNEIYEKTKQLIKWLETKFINDERFFILTISLCSLDFLGLVHFFTLNIYSQVSFFLIDNYYEITYYDRHVNRPKKLIVPYKKSNPKTMLQIIKNHEIVENDINS